MIEPNTYVVIGASGGIGRALAQLIEERGDHVIAVGRRPYARLIPTTADGIVCCNGSFERPMEDCYWRTKHAFAHCDAPINIALTGGGVGGDIPIDPVIPVDYIASKAALCMLVEHHARMRPDRQYFAVAPGQTATKLVGFKGADPKIPAAFIMRLLTGDYAHLSGSMLAAQRDNLDEMKPTRLRRVTT